jgi:hypothetical protein
MLSGNTTGVVGGAMLTSLGNIQMEHVPDPLHPAGHDGCGFPGASPALLWMSRRRAGFCR